MSLMTSSIRPTFADIDRAARQIAGVARRTPVVTSRTINARTRAEVYFKCENLQPGGAFTFRGAYNALSRLSADDATRSFRTKHLQTVHNPQTVADGARTPSLGSLTFPLVLEYASDMTTVDDPTLLKTMFFLWERLKLVVEPTGSLGAAAALHGTIPLAGARVGVILTGGNVDFSQAAEWLEHR